jgi:hypothetical protein
LSIDAKGGKMKKVLITGAGTGFGYEAAMRLAEKGFDVIATVEIWAQVQTLKRQAAARGVTLKVEKLDVTNEGDRRNAFGWEIEILVRNGQTRQRTHCLGFVSRRPEHEPVHRHLFSLKHAVEAVAETMSLELQEFGIEVATVNPGPFLTGFNDRGFETWKSWEDDPSERLCDYSKLAFPGAQFNPEPVYATLTAVAAGDVDTYRNLELKSMLEETKHLIDAPWSKKIRDGIGTRPPSLQRLYEMKPETPVP